ncbi:MAG: HlyD family efflux transporter periplasmic adaptor subunit [Pseudomonadota bacterium]
MRFLGRAISGGIAFAVIVALLWLGFRPYLGCAPGLDGVLGARCVFQSAEGGRPAGSTERVYSVALAALEPTTVTPRFTAYGEVRSGRTWEIRAEAAGRLVSVADGVRDGGVAREGQSLVKIDPADPAAARSDAASALLEAEAERADARRALELSRSELVAAEAQKRLRERLFERQKSLAARGISAEITLDEAELALADAERAVITREQAVAAAERRVAQSQAQLDRAQVALDRASRDLGETEIRAPFDGLLQIDADGEAEQAGAGLTLGRLVQVNEKLGALIDPRAMEVWFRVSNAQLARLIDEEGGLAALPATVRLSLGARAITAKARLTRMSATASPAEGGRRVYAALEVGPETLLRPGDFVSVEIAEPPLPRVIDAPASALDDQERLLVVGADDRLTALPVRVLRRVGERVYVRPAEGAWPPAGARYVAAVNPRLAPGVKVREARPPAGETAPPASEIKTDTSSAARPERLASAADEPTIALASDRRAELIAFVKGAARMPEERRARLVALLERPETPRRLVDRLERRMARGGAE